MPPPRRTRRPSPRKPAAQSFFLKKNTTSTSFFAPRDASAPTVQRQTAPAVPLTKDQKWAKITAILAQIPRGTEAVAIFQNRKPTLSIIDQEGGKPAYFLPNNKSVVVNVAGDSFTVASYFVHEMFHVEQDASGNSGNAATMDEKTFVDKMVAEEIMGTIRQFEMKMELRRLGQIVPIDTNIVEDRYAGAYKYKFDEAKAALKTDAEAHQSGLAQGRLMVKFLIDPPPPERERLSPNAFESYRKTYEREWRKTHIKPL